MIPFPGIRQLIHNPQFLNSDSSLDRLHTAETKVLKIRLHVKYDEKLKIVGLVVTLLGPLCNCSDTYKLCLLLRVVELPIEPYSQSKSLSMVSSSSLSSPHCGGDFHITKIALQ